MSDTNAIEVLRLIQSGQLDAKAIDGDDRRQLVEYLLAEGYSKAEMAAILKVSQRTVERDQKTLRQANAIEHEPKMAGRMAGRLIGEAELAIQQIRRICRDKAVGAAVKVDGHHRCYQIAGDLAVKLQGLGYLPTATAKVEAALVHHVGGIPTLEQIEMEHKRLAANLTTAVGNDQEVGHRVLELGGKITRAQLATEVDQLACSDESSERPSEENDQ